MKYGWEPWSRSPQPRPAALHRLGCMKRVRCLREERHAFLGHHILACPATELTWRRSHFSKRCLRRHCSCNNVRGDTLQELGRLHALSIVAHFVLKWILFVLQLECSKVGHDIFQEVDDSRTEPEYGGKRVVVTTEPNIIHGCRYQTLISRTDVVHTDSVGHWQKCRVSKQVKGF